MGGDPPWCGPSGPALAPASPEQRSGLVRAESAGGPPEQGPYFTTCLTLKPLVLFQGVRLPGFSHDAPSSRHR